VKVYNDIIRDGRVVRGSIGIKWKNSGSQTDTLQAFGLDHGVMVDTVSPIGPAGKAGLKPDDIIVAMNEKPIKDGDELVTKVADLPIGSAATFTVDRNGKKIDFRVPIGERSVVWPVESQVSEAQVETPAAPTRTKSIAPAKFGITIMRLTEKERQDLGIEDGSGVKVVSVDSGSFADDIGMQEGDAILSVNRQPVTSPDELMKVQASFKPGQAIAVHIARSSVGGRHAPPQRYYLSGRLPSD
jgi:serine protease Do